MGRDEGKAAHPAGDRVGYFFRRSASFDEVLLMLGDQVDVVLKMCGLAHTSKLRNDREADNTESSRCGWRAGK